MLPVLLAQIGFSTLPMLAWLAAAGIPIAIHLLRKRRQTVVNWAAMQLLQKVVDQQSRRTRIQQLILLMLRILALVLLAIALARPFLSSADFSLSGATARPNRVFILVVDTSYSMGYKSATGLTRLDQAKQYLSDAIGSSQTGDAFVLIAMDNPARAVISAPTFDLSGAKTELQKLRESACGCNVVEALSLAENIAAECKRSDTVPHDVYTIIVSDLGRDAWQTSDSQPEASDRNSIDLDGGLARNQDPGSRPSETNQTRVNGQTSQDILEALNQLKRLSAVHLEPILDSNPSNVAIESLTASTSRPMFGSTFTIDVNIASYGLAASGLPVQLELDGQVIASQTVDIQANSRIQIRFQASLNALGNHVISAVIPNDSLPIDDRYDLVVESATGNRVLIVQNGAKAKNAWQAALRAAAEDANATELQIRTISDIAFTSQSLEEWDVIVWDDVPISPTQLSRLATFIESGKGAIFGWGSRQALPQFSSMAEPLRRMVGFDFQNVSEESDWTIDPLDYRSPIVAPFSGFPNAGLLTTPIFRYWKIANRSTDLKVDIALSSGDPWLVRHRVGKGWVASFLSAPESGQLSGASSTWNAVTTWPSFLPLAQQLLQSISDVDSRVYNRLAGQPIGDRLALLAPLSSIRLQTPSGEELDIACSQPSESTAASWMYTNTQQRGVYRVNEPESARRAFAVNIDPVQSSLASVDPKRFAEYSKEMSDSESSLAEQLTSSDDSLARALLITLMIILVSESLLAWSLGRQSS